MSAPPKLELLPDEQFIQDAIKDGRCQIRDLPIRLLGEPDTAYQARVQHLDVGHVQILESIYQEQGKLGPAVVFMAGAEKSTRYILADGFHRYAALKNLGVTVILAHVVESAPGRIEHEARLFAAMCNRRMSLPRKEEDKRKAVAMLFADPECWTWSSQRIADHCGFATGKPVIRMKAEYALEHGLDLPKQTIDKTGRSSRPPRPITSGSDLPTIREHIRGDGSKEFRSWIGAKYVSLGSCEEESIDKLNTYIETSDLGEVQKFARKTEPSGKRTTLLRDLPKCKESPTKRRYDAQIRAKDLMSDFAKHGLVFKAINRTGTRYPQLRGWQGHGTVIVAAKLDSGESVPWAIGCLMMLRELSGHDDYRLVVVCYRDNGAPASIELARKLGIEFLTPDEFVASLKNSVAI